MIIYRLRSNSGGPPFKDGWVEVTEKSHINKVTVLPKKKLQEIKSQT